RRTQPTHCGRDTRGSMLSGRSRATSVSEQLRFGSSGPRAKWQLSASTLRALSRWWSMALFSLPSYVCRSLAAARMTTNGYLPFAVGRMKWDANVTAFSVMTADRDGEPDRSKPRVIEVVHRDSHRLALLVTRPAMYSTPVYRWGEEVEPV